MEDAYVALPELEGSKDVANSFFAVYDGHGGVATLTG
jgi:serine/threonine protein phosphatase PrpC